jgi:molecular chaperone HscB
VNLQSNDFELFGLAVRFSLDRSDLDQRWKQLQRGAHPDKFAAQGASAQRVAMQWSVRINEAYQRLKSPLKRAAYLCELNAQAIQAETNTAMPTAFLMKQMDWRESLDEQAEDLGELEVLMAEVQASKEETLAEIAQAIDGANNYVRAAELLRGLLFIEKFATELDDAIDALI